MGEISEIEVLEAFREQEQEILSILKEWLNEIGRSAYLKQIHKVKRIEQKIKKLKLKYKRIGRKNENR